MYRNDLGCDECEQGYNDLGIALPAIGAAISTVGGIFGTRTTGATVYREDGARWSAKKQYWEKPPGTKAAIQSPKPSGPADICTGAFACLQSMKGGPVYSTAGTPVQMAKGSAAPVSSPVSNAAGQYPITNASAMGGPVIAGMSTGPLLIAGLAAAAIFVLSSDKKRRR